MFCIMTFCVLVDLAMQNISRVERREVEKKRIVYCSHFMLALPEQCSSKRFSNITPACQKNTREQNREYFFFFFLYE